MSSGFQFFEIVLFAMVAAFLLVRLHRVLGRRTGHESPRSELRQVETDAETEDVPERVVPLPDRTAPPGDEAAARLSAGLAEIKLADRNFDEESFTAGAQAAFEWIINGFANGDKRQLQRLVDESVYRGFAEAIDRRVEAEESFETTLVAVDSFDVLEARVEGHHALITVKFVSQQIKVTRDADGTVIDGDPTRVNTVTDIWTFRRDTQLQDPNWQLVETRSPS